MKAPSLSDITRDNIESLLCHEQREWERKPAVFRIVEGLAEFSGTLTFLCVNVVLFVAWIAINSLGRPFDPYPYTFLTLVVSLEAILLSILILISQKMSSEANERRHHLDLQINLLNEREMTALMRLTLRISEKLQLSAEDQTEVRALAEVTKTDHVLDQIMAAETAHQR